MDVIRVEEIHRVGRSMTAMTAVQHNIRGNELQGHQSRLCAFLPSPAKRCLILQRFPVVGIEVVVGNDQIGRESLFRTSLTHKVIHLAPDRRGSAATGNRLVSPPRLVGAVDTAVGAGGWR